MKKAHGDDPCIGVCRFDQATGWCLGCGRSKQEVASWSKTAPYRRTALARDLPRRLARLAAQTDGRARERP